MSTNKLNLVSLGEFQDKNQIRALADFSNEYWDFGGWNKEAFYEDDSFPDKLQLSQVLSDTQDNVYAVLIASKQRERYLESALDDYLYMHKILIHPDLRGRMIETQSVFGFMFDSVVCEGEELGLYQQVLSVDWDNQHAINVYSHYEFEFISELSCGKLLMGRGFDS